jgi:uncharacterized protein YycO
MFRNKIYLALCMSTMATVGFFYHSSALSFTQLLSQAKAPMPEPPESQKKQWQPPSAPGSSSEPATPPLTSAQKKELEQAKIDAEKIKQEEKQRTKPKESPDKKSEVWRQIVLRQNGLQASKSKTLYASLPVTSRPGVFMVSMNDSSASSTSFAGGHAGMVYSSQNTVESYGNRSSQNGVYYYPNNWETRYRSIVARSVNGTTIDQDRQAAVRASQQVGKAYNYNFWDGRIQRMGDVEKETKKGETRFAF